MNVQHPKLSCSDVAEAVGDTDGGGDVRARTSTHDLVTDDKLGFALDHVEAIDVVQMAMGLHAFEVRPESQLDHFQFGEFGQDAVVARAARDPLAVAGVQDDSIAHAVASRLSSLRAARMAGAYPRLSTCSDGNSDAVLWTLERGRRA